MPKKLDADIAAIQQSLWQTVHALTVLRVNVATKKMAKRDVADVKKRIKQARTMAEHLASEIYVDE